MNRIVIAAAAFLCAYSGAAPASAATDPPGIRAGSSTTASVHCDALAGAKREACLRELRERDVTRDDSPAAGTRPPKESSRPPVKAAPAESKTPEDAAARAADPKAPSGALIIDTPSGKLPKP